MYDELDDLPNVMIVDDRQEDPDEIIEQYIELVYQSLGHTDDLRVTLQMFFDEASDWALENEKITKAKIALAELKIFREERDAFDDEDWEREEFEDTEED